MYIISWNVAGWNTTMKHILKHFKDLDNYLELHKVDILCLQEVKVTDKNLSEKALQYGINNERTSDYKFDSFWSVSSKKVGFNGVATFVRKGLTLSANRNIFNDKEYDSEGRCIVTFHQDNYKNKIALFNVYVPNAGMQGRLKYKHKFLLKLRLAMSKLRQDGYKIILCGDLNISRSAIDHHCSYLYINLKQLELLNPLDQNKNHKIDQILLRLKSLLPQLKELWQQIEIKKITFNTNDKIMERYRLRVKYLNKYHSFGTYQTKDIAIAHTLGKRYYNVLTEEIIHENNDEKNIKYIFWCASILDPEYSWNELLMRYIAHYAPTSIISSSSSTSDWINNDIIQQDHMIDTFRYFYPNIDGRYTVWHQYRNDRYINEGSRIDYFIVDKYFQPYLLAGTNLYATSSSSAEINNTKEVEFKDALNACTSYNQWKPALFDGSGVPEAKNEVYFTQFHLPHTGMIYTPPQFSDHIGVSVLLDIQFETCTLLKDKCTKKSQPHKRQTNILTLFKSIPKKQVKKKDLSASNKRKISSETSIVEKKKKIKSKKKKMI